MAYKTLKQEWMWIHSKIARMWTHAKNKGQAKPKHWQALASIGKHCFHKNWSASGVINFTSDVSNKQCRRVRFISKLCAIFSCNSQVATKIWLRLENLFRHLSWSCCLLVPCTVHYPEIMFPHRSRNSKLRSSFYSPYSLVWDEIVVHEKNTDP